MNEEDIYEENNQYIIKKEIDGKWITFGIFSDLNEAIEKRDELEDYGWPYQRKNDSFEKIEKHIYKKESRYLVVKKILNKKIIYGNFDTYDKAKSFKRKLIDNAWNLNSLNHRKKYGKYIKSKENKFSIYKNFGEKSRFFGSYDELDDAIIKRNELINNNWNMGESSILENIGVHELSDIDDKNIAKIGNKYTIYKWNGDTCSIYGMYSNYNEASLIRDKFIINKNIDYDILDEFQKDTKYIVMINDYYRISKFINGENITFGHFDDIDEAIEVRDLLIKHNWDKNIINKYKSTSNTYNNVHRHIHKSSRGFQVINRVDGQLTNFGTFNNLDEALKYRNYLEENGWVIYSDDEDIEEEKFDEYIYLKNDGYYYLKYEVNNEIRIFGIFDNSFDALAARLDCFKNHWNTFSILEEDYLNNNFSDSNLPFGEIIDEDSDELLEDEVIPPMM